MSRWLGFALLVLSASAHAGIQADDSMDALDLVRATVQGGLPVTAGEAYEKSTVLILTEDNRACTGTVVAADLILTAGHCVPDSDKVKIAVLTDFGMQGTVPQIARKAKIIKAQSFMRHPEFRIVVNREYGTQTAENDIALIRLRESIVNPTVALLPKADTMISPFDAVTVAGYGMGNSSERFIEPPKRVMVLRKAAVNIMIDGTTPKTFTIKGARNTCAGDSGGPSFMKNEKGLVIVGVHSSSNGCYSEEQDTRSTATDTYVPYFTEWIKGAARTLRGTQGV